MKLKHKVNKITAHQMIKINIRTHVCIAFQNKDHGEQRPEIISNKNQENQDCNGKKYMDHFPSLTSFSDIVHVIPDKVRIKIKWKQAKGTDIKWLSIISLRIFSNIYIYRKICCGIKLHVLSDSGR